ncbi:hypothetical protein GH714_020238 [Hevea brasiliensis]|uniref:Uncharacterized protein n=1 Tax=Hevea brasiliensis TaxID=3981 RepID=A0A6A6L0G1_HEVBR|nr:hypothetical protein GH714_020238 [Hevea brasiliensis]
MYLPCCLSPNFGYHECEDWTVLVLLGIEKHLQVQLLGPNFSDTLAGNSGGDANLLLFCDYAAHTYCVGLGATLPEVGNSSVTEVDEVDVSIFDIVCESNDQLFGRPRARFSPVPIFSERQPSLANDLTWPREGTPQLGSVERAPQSDANRVTQTGARTLSRCRNV